MAQRLKELRDILDGGYAVRVQRSAALWRSLHQADPKVSRVGADLLDEWSALRRRRIRVSGHVTGDSVEHRRAVAHRTSHDVLDGQSVPGIACVGPERYAAARWLESDQAAFAGGDANRAAAVVGV